MNSFDIVSIGRIAGQLQCPPQKLHAIAQQLGIMPAGRINGILHYAADDIERIAAQLRSLDSVRVPTIEPLNNLQPDAIK